MAKTPTKTRVRITKSQLDSLIKEAVTKKLGRLSEGSEKVLMVSLERLVHNYSVSLGLSREEAIGDIESLLARLKSTPPPPAVSGVGSEPKPELTSLPVRKVA